MRYIETDRFDCTIGERAAFEAGIKLASLYHQFIGAPVGPENLESLRTAMEDAMKAQPHVVEASVSIDRELLERETGRMGYRSLSERMISASVTVRVGGVECGARMEYVNDLDYPLMWVDHVSGTAGGSGGP